MSENINPASELENTVVTLVPAYPIPSHLVGEVQSKLAYVDEEIIRASITASGNQISIFLRQVPDEARQVELEEKIQRVVVSMAKGAIRPKIQVLEDHLDKSVPYRLDPMAELQRRGEISQEATGIFALGPLVARLIDYFESRFLELAGSFHATPYRFPTLIPARYLERITFPVLSAVIDLCHAPAGTWMQSTISQPRL
jgi:hypothetical protein